MAGITLKKGQSQGVTVSLSKESGGSSRFAANLFWKTATFGGADMDMDIMAIVTDESGKILNDDGRNIVFYNSAIKESACKAVTISEDDRTGGGAGVTGPQEWCKLDFTRIDPSAKKVDLIIDIHQAVNRNQNFGQVNDGRCVIRDEDKGSDLIEYWFDTNPGNTGILLCEFVRRGSDWVFKVKEQGYKGGLEKVLEQYGINAG